MEQVAILERVQETDCMEVNTVVDKIKSKTY